MKVEVPRQRKGTAKPKTSMIWSEWNRGKVTRQNQERHQNGSPNQNSSSRRMENDGTMRTADNMRTQKVGYGPVASPKKSYRWGLGNGMS